MLYYIYTAALFLYINTINNTMPTPKLIVVNNVLSNNVLEFVYFSSAPLF